ncbi:DedA family protein [Micavibrio aeruginosavorus]|uniref:DedA protein n=1 Tax=Micavibrio aeruginosavorus EPB TaxID=349215 RepID=M4VUZ2_9BACT|nr:VTT domain-containing protein [Micavibrio aeruginosavorus]AGH96999.1 DedA protein [Micavibrio aeruginosavorus EPB]
MHFDILHLIETLGMWGVWAVVFAESGILFCFFMPGDSLLFAAGVLAGQDLMPIALLAGGCFIAAVTGNLLGYEIGKRVGMKIINPRTEKFLKPEYLQMTSDFFEKHGKMAVVLARFMPIIRTFTPFLAGMVGMSYRVFFIYTIVGAVFWAIGLTMLGFFLGDLIPQDKIDMYILPIILLIILISVLPSVFHIWKEMRARKAVAPENDKA